LSESGFPGFKDFQDVGYDSDFRGYNILQLTRYSNLIIYFLLI